MISGFITLKNVLKQGYPFVEAIAASLPVCDEFLISEGYSTDGTYEVCEKMAQLNKKIKLFRDEWPCDRRDSIIADVTNIVRARCNGDYLLSIQANEIIHEESVALIRALPEIYPKRISFSLPFIHFFRDYQFNQEFRLRFTKNVDSIISVSDAWTLGLSRSFIKSEMLKGIRNPKRLLSYTARGIEWIYANSGMSHLSRAIYLPKPIYRYWSLFPCDHIEKCQKHIEMFGGEHIYSEPEALKSDVDNPEHFWKKAVELRQKDLDIHYPVTLRKVNAEEHPKIIKDLLISDSTVTHYHIRDEILNSIKNL
jgi:glycosyltransferase involved in cell wall biosynthesis